MMADGLEKLGKFCGISANGIWAISFEKKLFGEPFQSRLIDRMNVFKCRFSVVFLFQLEKVSVMGDVGYIPFFICRTPSGFCMVFKVKFYLECIRKADPYHRFFLMLPYLKLK